MKIKDIIKKRKNKSKANAKSKSNNNDASSITPPSDDTPTEDNSNLIFVGGIAGYSEDTIRGKSFKQMQEDSLISKNRINQHY